MKHSKVTSRVIDDEITLEAAVTKFADHLTENEKRSFDEIDMEAFIDAEHYFASLTTENDVFLELIKHWFDFFKQNEIYENYCDAKRRGNDVVISELEHNYPEGEHRGIVELFKDWGDIHANDFSFDEWIAKNRSLFFRSDREVIPIEMPIGEFENGLAIVRLPKGIDDKMELWSIFSKYWHQHYLPLYATYTPKYSINARVPIDVLRKLEMAILTDDILLYDDPSEKLKRDSDYSHAQVAKTIMFNPLLRYRFGLGKEWRPDSPSKSNCDVTLEDRLHKKNLKMSEFDSKKPHIIELEQLYKACVDDTIFGVFPGRSRKK